MLSPPVPRLLGGLHPQGPQRNQVLTGPSYPAPVRPTVGRVRGALELDDGVTLYLTVLPPRTMP
ncbi:hypothetical protein [Microbispora sp. NBRC 16548]|uniref:hypothetical protein n=1 Tax=Microbispora sp. NBRC 16548 TaxID=3030994 RepID=UPI00160E5F97|nr:hypothetical protein [Microbispora sp. NBRC 16548]GLX03739.1 hypothetical protein Misp03_06660 [Microbispora sp. NBRC 16548]